MFVHGVYNTTKVFPKEELFGATNQLRRAVLSVALNYVEGYARHTPGDLRRFLKISYGSLKEALYLIRFACERKWVQEDVSNNLKDMGDEIARMLWSTFSRF